MQPSSNREQIINDALNFADEGPYSIRKKVRRFMIFLHDSDEEFTKDEIEEKAIELYGINRIAAEGSYKNVIETAQESAQENKRYRKFFA
jgi:hypothetical protein